MFLVMVQRRLITTGSGPTTKYTFRTESIAFSRLFRWYQIPLSIGVLFIIYQRYLFNKRCQEVRRGSIDNAIYSHYIASDLQVSFMKMLPLKTVSKGWGWVNSLYLPVCMRNKVIGLYSRKFGVMLPEAEVEDFKSYTNLGEFFRRSLKPGCRPIADGDIVSPADGRILHLGEVCDGQMEQVKGINYSLRTFLGNQSWNSSNVVQMTSDEYQRQLLTGKNTSLYHCIIYLAPGDYHRFHSPTQWSVNFRRHFPGSLLSVRPNFANWIPGLFNINERVMYAGTWKHGFFSMTAVGAVNVGSIKMYFDEEVSTNLSLRKRHAYFYDKSFKVEHNFEKGDAFGEFNLGSTIVLVFEAPKDLKFDIQPGEQIKYGELVGYFNEQNDKNNT